jgi:spermidine synthase
MMPTCPCSRTRSRRTCWSSAAATAEQSARSCAPEAKRVDICEIDGDVVAVQKVSSHNVRVLRRPRVTLYTEDGAKFMKEPGHLHVILVDSSDPIGPRGRALLRGVLRDMKNPEDDGLIAKQCESFFYHGTSSSALPGTPRSTCRPAITTRWCRPIPADHRILLRLEKYHPVRISGPSAWRPCRAG